MAKGGRQPGAGRPKGSLGGNTLEAQRVKALLIAEVEKRAAPLIEALMTKAENGDVQAIREVFDRIFGKPSQSIDHTTQGDKITGNQVVFVDFNDTEPENQ